MSTGFYDKFNGQLVRLNNSKYVEVDGVELYLYGHIIKSFPMGHNIPIESAYKWWKCKASSKKYKYIKSLSEYSKVVIKIYETDNYVVMLGTPNYFYGGQLLTRWQAPRGIPIQIEEDIKLLT